MTKYFKRSALPLRNNRGTPSRFLSAGPLVLFFTGMTLLPSLGPCSFSAKAQHQAAGISPQHLPFRRGRTRSK